MINLTRQEKMVIQLLVACFLVGATIRIYKMRSNRINNEKSRQQTVVTDSFQLYASQIDSEYTELQKSGHSTYQSQKSAALQQKINFISITKINCSSTKDKFKYRNQTGAHVIAKNRSGNCRPYFGISCSSWKIQQD